MAGSSRRARNTKISFERVFESAARSLKPDATVYIRTDSRKFTYETTTAALKRAFPGKRLYVRRQPLKGFSQTKLFGQTSKTRGEMDLVLTPAR